MRCYCDPRDHWGFDKEDGVFRCRNCGTLVKKPPRWLRRKFEAALWEFIQEAQRRHDNGGGSK